MVTCYRFVSKEKAKENLEKGFIGYESSEDMINSNIDVESLKNSLSDMVSDSLALQNLIPLYENRIRDLEGLIEYISIYEIEFDESGYYPTWKVNLHTYIHNKITGSLDYQKGLKHPEKYVGEKGYKEMVAWLFPDGIQNKKTNMVIHRYYDRFHTQSNIVHIKDLQSLPYDDRLISPNVPAIGKKRSAWQKKWYPKTSKWRSSTSNPDEPKPLYPWETPKKR